MSLCAKCHTPLTVEIEPDEDENEESMAGSSSNNASHTVPDDVHLPCNCHFHWECLLESYELDKCPHCTREIVTVSDHRPTPFSSSASPTQQILVNLSNEGGVQEQTDILPILKEESYLRAYPEERKCRAFLEFCREGDHRAIVDLLKRLDESATDDEEDLDMTDEGELESSGPAKSADDVLRYQDPIGEMASGLHAAVANGHREVAWLLLLLASELSEMEFPALVFQEAASLGIMREDQAGKVDIRSLKDSHDRTAEDLAKETGDLIWTGWIGNGRLAVS
jgi:hypothetical protein